MNRKGEIILSYIFGAIAVCMVVAAFALTPSHRIRQANEFCVRDGGSITYCEISVDNMGKEEILEYIKDDDMIGNGGNY